VNATRYLSGDSTRSLFYNEVTYTSNIMHMSHVTHMTDMLHVMHMHMTHMTHMLQVFHIQMTHMTHMLHTTLILYMTHMLTWYTLSPRVYIYVRTQLNCYMMCVCVLLDEWRLFFFDTRSLRRRTTRVVYVLLLSTCTACGCVLRRTTWQAGMTVGHNTTSVLPDRNTATTTHVGAWRRRDESN
jgi:hypothetical protein